MACRWLAVLFATGCSFPAGHRPDGGTDLDAVAPGTTDDDAHPCWSVAELSVTFCLTAPLGSPITFGTSSTVDTDTSPDCRDLQPGSTSACVIAAGMITIPSTTTISATGARPLVLIANQIQIDGTLDAASHIGQPPGPAADMIGCNYGTDGRQGGGGQGGSYAEKGGDGGDKNGDNGAHGAAGGTISGTVFRGGCHGGSTTSGGLAGAGGGAVMLIANSISLGAASAINASGASGFGAGPSDLGGGGGGSGGMIAFATPTVSLGGAIFANGGHGGGGSNGGSGQDGIDPVDPGDDGNGGNGDTMAGRGGPGYPNANRAGVSGGGMNAGGGGGGGGPGRVRFFPPLSLVTANISPPPS